MSVCTYLAYSPDVAPCDFYLYYLPKKKLEARWYQSELDAIKGSRKLSKVVTKKNQNPLCEY